MPKGVAIWGDELRKFREERLLSQAELAREIDVSLRTIQRIEQFPVVYVQVKLLRSLAEMTGATVEGVKSRLMLPPDKAALFVRGEPVSPDLTEETPADDAKIVRDGMAEIPLFDLSVACGPWADVSDVPDVFPPEILSQGLFRVRLAGDSMKPQYSPGEIIEFRVLGEYDAIEPGRDYYVQKDDGTATMKRVKKVTEDEIILEALNRKKYPEPYPASRREIVRMAKAVSRIEPIE